MSDRVKAIVGQYVWPLSCVGSRCIPIYVWWVSKLESLLSEKTGPLAGTKEA
jgi:hypothetical protein